MLGKTNLLDFSDVNGAPEGPGLYAWYYAYRMSLPDIERVTLEIAGLGNDTKAKVEQVRAFLAERLLEPLREQPYRASISGPLKPTYEGALAYQPPDINDVSATIARYPALLLSIGEVFAAAPPLLASPIYIGLAAKGLRRRLREHKKLIETYRELGSGPWPGHEDGDADDEDTCAAHSFAREVVLDRKLVPHHLRVAYLEIAEPGPDVPKRDLLRTVEFLLNRIYFPLCGRR